ncbi:MAG: discoidin domain-containing protein [Bacteroidales bacterium]|nr:discoidin domain-containing protein [Bacteroidales bacterium]
MAYIPPSSDAINFNFQTSGYVPVSGDSISFDFSDASSNDLIFSESILFSGILATTFEFDTLFAELVGLEETLGCKVYINFSFEEKVSVNENILLGDFVFSWRGRTKIPFCAYGGEQYGGGLGYGGGSLSDIDKYLVKVHPLIRGDGLADLTNPIYSIGNENPLYKSAFDNLFGGNATQSWYCWDGGYINHGWIGQDFGEGNEKIINRYRIYTSGSTRYNPKTWTFEGSYNGTDWFILHTVNNASLGVNTWYEYYFVNGNSYRYYRINVTQNGGDAIYLIITEIEMMSGSDYGDPVYSEYIDIPDKEDPDIIQWIYSYNQNISDNGVFQEHLAFFIYQVDINGNLSLPFILDV